jgi:hypothetical protein
MAYWVNARALEELADDARAARRRGWPFADEIVATADTRRVPTPPLGPPGGSFPRRYATNQPTEPIIAVRPR